MKPNPRPDLLGAPVYLPDTGEMVLNSLKHVREIVWMAHMFWQLLDEIDSDEEAQFKELDSNYDSGWDAGFEEGFKHRRERELQEGDI